MTCFPTPSRRARAPRAASLALAAAVAVAFVAAGAPLRAATINMTDWAVGEVNAPKAVKQSFIISAGPGETITPSIKMVSNPALFLKTEPKPVSGEEGKKYVIEVTFLATFPGDFRHFVHFRTGLPDNTMLTVAVHGTVRAEFAFFHTGQGAGPKRVMADVERLKTQFPNSKALVKEYPLDTVGNVALLDKNLADYGLPAFAPPPMLLIGAGQVYVTPAGIRAALEAAFSGEDLPPRDFTDPRDTQRRPEFIVGVFYRYSCKPCEEQIGKTWNGLRAEFGDKLLQMGIGVQVEDLDRDEVRKQVEGVHGAKLADVPETVVIAAGPPGRLQIQKVGDLATLDQVREIIRAEIANREAQAAARQNPPPAPAQAPTAAGPTAAGAIAVAPAAGPSAGETGLLVVILLGVIFLTVFSFLVFAWMRRMEAALRAALGPAALSVGGGVGDARGHG
ncbi:MAG: hypothetical protein HY719_10645 [Planctomycetes bacterium]|nr:hypothetical protein [Planctomycetota bacterium]